MHCFYPETSQVCFPQHGLQLTRVARISVKLSLARM